MDKTFWISGIVIAVLSLALGFVVHGMLLGNDYYALQHLYRTPEESKTYFPYMLLAHVLFGFAFTWIYRQGIVAGRSALGQGVRFGIAVALLMTIPTYLIYYAVQPLPMSLVSKQIAFDLVAVIIMGAAVGLLNRPSYMS